MERSASNYRYYDVSMIDRIQWIEQQKQAGKCLDTIKLELHVQQAEEIDIQDLRLQMLLLEKNVAKIMAQTTEEERQQIQRKVSPESLALMQALILLVP